MNFLVRVPVTLGSSAGLESTPRSVTRVPGFRQLIPVPSDRHSFEIEFEVEAGSAIDALDAAEDEVAIYEDALEQYSAKVGSPVEVELLVGALV